MKNKEKFNKINVISDLRKTKVLDIDISFPPSDFEGPKFANQLDNLIRKIGFNELQKSLIRASLIIAKKWGTEENKSFVPFIRERDKFYGLSLDNVDDIKETHWLRRSGRTAMTHFLESAIIALQVIGNIKNIDKNILTKIICVALLHDTVEDSKGLYNFDFLKYDLTWFAIKPSINTAYCRGKFLSFEDANIKRIVNNRHLKSLIDDIIEGVHRLTIEKTEEDLIDLILKLVENFDKKDNFEGYKLKSKKLLKLYNSLHESYKKKIKVSTKKGEDVFRKELKKYLMEIRPKEEKNLEQLSETIDKFFQSLSFERLDEIDFMSILVRLSETITAIGVVDIEGFTKGEYGISNIDMKRVVYLKFLEKVAPYLDDFFGEGTSKKLKEIFDLYLSSAERIVKSKLTIEQVKLETQENLFKVLSM